MLLKGSLDEQKNEGLNGLYKGQKDKRKTSLTKGRTEKKKWTEKMERQRRVLMVILLAALGSFSEAYCPFLCQCDDTKRKVVCSPKANLDIIPITLNPAIKEIHLRGNQIRYL